MTAMLSGVAWLMKPTSQEVDAVHKLAEAALAFLLAHEDGRAARERLRPKVEATCKVILQPSHQPSPPCSDPPRPAVDEIDRSSLLSTRDAAKFLCIGGRKLWEITAPRGPLPAVRIGTSVKYTRGDLDAFIERAKKRSKPWPDQMLPR